MANKEHVKILNQGVEIWNKWREDNRWTAEHKWIDVDLSGANLMGANLMGAELRLADLRKANLNGVNLSEANLNGVNLCGADLSGSNLMEANLIGAELNEAILTEANLFMADLSDANLCEASMNRTDLRLARLINTNLSNATLTGSCLYGTARDDWIIDGVKCDYVYWNGDIPLLGTDTEKKQWEREHRFPKDRDFEHGEFEKRYKQMPTISEHFDQKSVVDLVRQNESNILEFKSTLQWDVRQNRQNKERRFDCLKTIAAFLNSEGGTLLIGVEDDGIVLGLQHDLSTFTEKQDLDNFEQTLMNLIKDYIGADIARFLNVQFEQLSGKDVCIVDVKKAARPVLMTKQGQKFFYIRLGNTTVQIKDERMLRYVQEHWK